MAFYHCVHGKSLFVVVFVGPCPFRFLLCFSAGWRNANLAGGSACRLLFGCFCVLFWVFDLPCYMTTGVHVEFISNCFFTCKDRALERDRPYQKKKKVLELRHLISSQRRLWTLHIYVANIPRYIDPVCLKLCRDASHLPLWRSLSWCLESVMLWCGITGFTKFGDKCVNDLDLL